MKITRRKLLFAGAAVVPAGLAAYWAFGRPSATGTPEVQIIVEGEKRIFRSNGIPDHAVGDFPNWHDPVPLRPQQHRLEMPLQPTIADQPVPVAMWLFGMAINGIPFDPSGPYWNADGSSGWQFEVLHPTAAVVLGIDPNRGHTQGRGTYHYHGLPTGLLWNRTVAAPDRPMHLLGYAADGFPIYGPDCPGDPTDLRSRTRRLRSSYRLRTGSRKDGPGGRFDGLFVEDFEFLPGQGDLDECNGRSGPTPEYPEGIYYYVVTDDYPFIPRHYRGQPDPSFRHGPPPGVSPPVPPELRRYSSRS